jgi:hypothetical protein
MFKEHQMIRPRDSTKRRAKNAAVATGWQRALEMLAASPDGATEPIVVAHGFAIPLMVELVCTGRAAAQSERMRAGKQPIEVTRMHITDAGQRVLDGKHE